MKSSLCHLSEMAPGTPACDFALAWFRAGFAVIPIVARKKVPSVRWNPWLRDSSEQKIQKYYERHPDDELGVWSGQAFCDNLVKRHSSVQPSLIRNHWG